MCPWNACLGTSPDCSDCVVDWTGNFESNVAQLSLLAAAEVEAPGTQVLFYAPIMLAITAAGLLAGYKKYFPSVDCIEADKFVSI